MIPILSLGDAGGGEYRIENMINSPLEEIQRHHRRCCHFLEEDIFEINIFSLGIKVLIWLGSWCHIWEIWKTILLLWIFTSGGGFSWRNEGLGDLVNSLNIWASEFKHQRYATFETATEGWLTSENATKIPRADKHSFVGQENIQIRGSGVQPALNSFNSVLFDGKFLCTHSSGPIAQFCFPTNQTNMRCNPWILCGSQLAKDRPWPGDENGARCHLSKANCRSAAFKAGAPSSSPFGTNGAVHTSTTSIEYTYSNAIRMQAQIQIQTFPTLSYVQPLMRF